MNARFAGMIAAGFVALVAGRTADAAIRKVPQQYSTIQAAVNASIEGDTVRVAPGTYVEHVLIRDKAISLLGAGAEQTSIDGGNDGRVVTVSTTGSGQVTVAGFTLLHGSVTLDNLAIEGPTQGGGLYAEYSNITVRNNVFTQNLGCLGNAIATLEATVSLVRNRIENNRSVPGCGQQVIFLRANRGAVSSVTGNVIQNHQATGLYLQAAGKVTVSNNVIRNNIANSDFEPFIDYGGLLSLYTELTLTNNLFTGNSGYAVGGALVSEFEGGTVRVTNNSFVGNRSVVGVSALLFSSYQIGSFVIQQNRFDESLDQPVITCAFEDVIDRSNIFASDPQAALTGACIPEEQ